MSLLSDPDIDRMRATLDQSLPETCVIETPSYTDNSGGGGTLAWTTAGTADCRISPLTGDERLRGERVAEDSDWIVTLPAETPIDVQSRILVNGGTFNVSAVRERGTWELSRRVEVTEST